MALLVSCGLVASVGGASGAARAPRCFGAAARDPLQPCHNPMLDRSFVPSVGRALLTPSAPCRPLTGQHPEVCTFGARLENAGRQVALIGDSHAVHWRAALAPIARRRHWHVYQLYASECPLSAAPALIAGSRGPACRAWRHDVFAWLRRHPAVGTVVVSEHRVPVRVDPGQSQLAVEVLGYVRAWTELPASVGRIVVIRDIPHGVPSTPDCLNGAVARGRPPGIACRLRRSVSLHADPAVVAARIAQPPRVRVVDLKRYFCDSRYCYPVIGGVLVRKDHGHMTRTYAETMAPYLDRALTPLLTPAPGGNVLAGTFGAWAAFT